MGGRSWARRPGARGCGSRPVTARGGSPPGPARRASWPTPCWAARPGSRPRSRSTGSAFPAPYPDRVIPPGLRVGVNSSTAHLRDVLVKRPGTAFGAAFDDPAHGFLWACDLTAAQREHDGLVAALDDLGVRVHALDHEPVSDPD